MTPDTSADAPLRAENSERKQPEVALRDIESSYRTLFENMLDGFAYCQMLYDEHGQPNDFVYLAVNNAFGRLTGLENVIGKKVTQLIPGITELHPELFQAYGRVAAAGHPEKFEIDFKPLDLCLCISVYCPMTGYFVAVFDDITQRTRSDDALRTNEQRFRIMADGLPQMVWVTDAQAQLQFVNKTYYEFFGVTPEQITDPGWQPLMHSDDVAAYAGELSACTRDRRPFRAEVRARRFDGEWRCLESQAQARFSVSGEFLGMVGSSSDITERKQTEEALAESQQFTCSVLNDLFAFVGVMTADGTLIDVNRAPLEAAGIAASEVLGKKFWDCYWWSHSPEIQTQVRKACERAAGGEIVRYDVPVRMAGDKRMWIDFQISPLRDTKGHITHLIPSAMDIAVRHATEDKLRASEARTLLATEATAVGIWEWDITTDTIRWDAQMFRLYGIALPPDGLIKYSDWRDTLLPEDLPETERILQDVLQSAGPIRCTFRIRRRDDGATRLIESVQTVRTNAYGKTQWMVGTNLDVTERKTAEIQLQQLAAKLTDADRQKNEFLATLAHELRNPLAPIRNGLQLMKLADGQPAKIEKARSMIERQMTQMVRLIDDLMEVSRISLGKLELRKERLSLALALNNAVETINPLVSEMGHQLTITLPEEALIVDADITRLTQVFANLLSNAAKYSGLGGQIQVQVERQHNDVVVTVKDNGIGIAADQLSTVFEMFTQLDMSLDKSHSGLGIGLTLVKRLVELHGGRVDAFSEGLGKGSEFVVRLPLVDEVSKPHESGAAAERSVKSSVRILVVDDNRDGADSLSAILQIMGNDTRTVYDGQAAVDTAVKFRPNVVLLDIGLPKLDGYEVCRRIRAQPGGERVVLIALTGWGQDEDRRRSHDAGFDHHLVKPVKPRDLMELIAGLDVSDEQADVKRSQT
jgi:PAS domain S-box-containing protein